MVCSLPPLICSPSCKETSSQPWIPQKLSPPIFYLFKNCKEKVVLFDLQIIYAPMLYWNHYWNCCPCLGPPAVKFPQKICVCTSVTRPLVWGHSILLSILNITFRCFWFSFCLVFLLYVRKSLLKSLVKFQSLWYRAGACFFFYSVLSTSFLMWLKDIVVNSTSMLMTCSLRTEFPPHDFPICISAINDWIQKKHPFFLWQVVPFACINKIT